MEFVQANFTPADFVFLVMAVMTGVFGSTMLLILAHNDPDYTKKAISRVAACSAISVAMLLIIGTNLGYIIAVAIALVAFSAKKMAWS